MLRKEATLYQDPLWLEQKLYPKSLTYNTPLVYQIKSLLDILSIKESIDYFVNQINLEARSFFTEEKNDVKNRYAT